jgi:CBS domain containing-hemolysin-like protein/mannitol/fructose-specific phosphotransferase system IIA component
MPVIALYLSIAIVLLLLNGFFVLAELGIVRMRPSRVEELSDAGDPRAKIVRHIQQHMDDYLSVFQLGITLASVGLGFCGERVAVALIQPFLWRFGEEARGLSHSISITVAYVSVSFLHILLGELVPKSLAMRKTDRAALFAARPLQFFRALFYVPLKMLSASAKAVLTLLGMSSKLPDEQHSEEELRIILGHSQTGGLMPFRRLLLLENVLDLGELKVKDAMKPRAAIRVLDANDSWDKNFAVMRDSRFSRLPLMGGLSDRPIGVIHVKDLMYVGPEHMAQVDLKKLVRPYYTTNEETPLENLFAELQRRRIHLAIVLDAAGAWTGLITMEDVIEEIVGTVEDEFELEPPIYVGDTLTPGRILLGVEAPSLEEGLKTALARIPGTELPLPAETISRLVRDRARVASTYLGRGLCVPYARTDKIDRAALIFARSEQGFALRGRPERVHLLFVLLTPANQPHVQTRLLSRIWGLTESEYVEERLHEATTPQELLEAIKAGEAAVLG